MANVSSAHYGSKAASKTSRTPRVWFVLFSVSLALWTAFYLFSHSYMGITGYEVSRFSSADIRHINSILVSGNPANQQATPYNAPGKHRINNTNDGFLDSDPTSNNGQNYSEYPQTSSLTFFSEEETKRRRTKLAMTYIISQYGHEISQPELVNIERYISTFTPRETGIFLADYRLRLSSYFWFSGVMAYAEVISWVIFGVLCSLLFYAGGAMRKGNGNNIFYQLARLVYAPFAAVILVLAYVHLKGGSTLNTEIDEAILIFAFLIGLTSGIVLDLLDRLRNNRPAVALPHTDVTPYISGREQVTKKQTTVHTQPTPTTRNEQEDDEEETEVLRPTPVVQPAPKKQAGEDNEIAEVAIDLKLDFSGLFDEERQQLQRLGFSKAIVTLHNVNGKDIIPAQKQKNDKTIFIATDVKPGIYIARATLSHRLRDDQIMNLFGEKTAYITEDKPGLELFVKKYEAAD